MKCMLVILSTEKMSDKVTKEERERKFFDFFNCHFRPPHGFINEGDSEHGFAWYQGKVLATELPVTEFFAYSFVLFFES